MSRQNVILFFILVEQSPSLKQKVKTAANKEELLNIAREAGYSFSADDLKAVAKESESDELSEQEIETIAGGSVKQIAHEVVETAKDIWQIFWG
ncbi:MAG: Nif11-like leader peptide family natural product precursor [Hydrococcus sp. Prado102]|jgi:predicted ribosomally synthesized peptide with nif11-like leader|nr:Nif11-like leader peptide family natural product precursor [Hydrococcus sp. Prado102]